MSPDDVFEMAMRIVLSGVRMGSEISTGCIRYLHSATEGWGSRSGEKRPLQQNWQKTVNNLIRFTTSSQLGKEHSPGDHEPSLQSPLHSWDVRGMIKPSIRNRENTPLFRHNSELPALTQNRTPFRFWCPVVEVPDQSYPK